MENKLKIEGFVYPEEKAAFYKGGRDLIIYKNRIYGLVPVSISKTTVWITEYPMFWKVRKKRA